MMRLPVLHRRQIPPFRASLLQLCRRSESGPSNNADSLAMAKVQPPVLTTLRAIECLVEQRVGSEMHPVVTALISARQMEKVEAILRYICERKPDDWRTLYDNSSTLNSLVEAYLELGNLDRVSFWRQRMHHRQDSLTFALFLRHSLRNGYMFECSKILSAMEQAGVRFESVWEEGLLTVADRITLSSVAPQKVTLPLSGSLSQNDSMALLDITDLLAERPIDPNNSENPPALLRPATNLLPSVTSVQSKSKGIDFIKNSLRALAENPNIDRFVVQEQLERDCYTATIEKLRLELEALHKIGKNPKNLNGAKPLLAHWHNILSEHIRDLLNEAAENDPEALTGEALKAKKIRPTSAQTTPFLYNFLLAPLDPAKISLICLQEITRITGIEPDLSGTPIPRVSISIGNSLERECFAQQISQRTFLQHARLGSKDLTRVFNSRRVLDRTMRKTYAALEENIEARQSGWVPKWSTRIKAEVGTFLVQLCINLLKMPDGSSPAFFHDYGYRKQRAYGIIKLDRTLLELLSSENAVVSCEPWAMPMVVPPRPWLTYNSGGYLTHRNIYVRLKEDPVHLSLIHQANTRESTDKVLVGLDILGSTAWRINERVLTVALELWNSGVNVSTFEDGRLWDKDLVSEHIVEGLDAVAGSSADKLAETHFTFRPRESFATEQEYINFVREAIAYRQLVCKTHSTMCDTNYKLEIARQYVGIPFYLPHSVDFRGRSYPIPPHLSHIGSDLSRGLLRFAEGHPLGERGLRWLKIQLANMAGVDKAPFEERVAFTEANLEKIFDSADNPLGGQQWWRQADEPWQCLAACFELSEALRSPNPTEYVSSFPIQLDGSCNGLQHYAALGGDIGGAQQVNLLPSDRPQDIYAEVARLVSVRIDGDAREGKEIALLLKGKINRKIVKQPVMTNVYGVTRYGAKTQVEARLKEYKIVGKEHMSQAREYITSLIFESLASLFVNAKKIQDWLTETAIEVSRSVPLEAAIRLGYHPRIDCTATHPNIRKYRKPAARSIQGQMMAAEGSAAENMEGDSDSSTTTLASILDPGHISRQMSRLEVATAKADPSARYPQTPVVWETPLGFRVVQPYLRSKTVQLRTVLQQMALRESSLLDTVNVSKQASAFPPNYIHSLDATHMFKTALACHEAGLTFASVHDCFWTHASSVDEMARHIRAQFIDLHGQPILERLHANMVNRYRGYKVPVLLKQVKKSEISSALDAVDSEEYVESEDVVSVQEKGKSRKKKASPGAGGHNAWRDIWIPPPPTKGNLDLSQVMKSEYFFS